MPFKTITYKYKVEELSDIYTGARACFGSEDLIIQIVVDFNYIEDKYSCKATAIEETDVPKYIESLQNPH